jgi:flagellar hook-length control protein FliK
VEIAPKQTADAAVTGQDAPKAAPAPGPPKAPAEQATPVQNETATPTQQAVQTPVNPKPVQAQPATENLQSAIRNLQSPATPAVQAQPAPQQPVAEPQAISEPRAGLHQAVETVYAVIRMSQSRGITQARVQLHPQELGQVDIHLRSTPEGLVARVVADAAQAAGVLRHAGDELRRALEGQGINLVRLDVGTAGHDERRSAFAQGDGQPPRNRGQGAAQDDDAGTPTETTIEETTIRLPNGVLVDVLA